MSCSGFIQRGGAFPERVSRDSEVDVLPFTAQPQDAHFSHSSHSHQPVCRPHCSLAGVSCHTASRACEQELFSGPFICAIHNEPQRQSQDLNPHLSDPRLDSNG